MEREQWNRSGVVGEDVRLAPLLVWVLGPPPLRHSLPLWDAFGDRQPAFFMLIWMSNGQIKSKRGGRVRGEGAGVLAGFVATRLLPRLFLRDQPPSRGLAGLLPPPTALFGFIHHLSLQIHLNILNECVLHHSRHPKYTRVSRFGAHSPNSYSCFHLRYWFSSYRCFYNIIAILFNLFSLV